MDDKDIIAVWKSLDAKFERSLVVNQKLLQDVQAQKIQSKLLFLSLGKIVGIIAFSVWLCVLAVMIAYAVEHYSNNVLCFLVSAILIFLVNVKGLFDYAHHLILIRRVDYKQSVVEIQKRLATIQVSIINHSKSMVVQFPFFTTLYLNGNITENATWWYWVFQITLTGSFVAVSYWLFTHLNINNKDKVWFKHLVAGSGGTSIKEAIEFLEDIEEFQQ